MKKGAPTAAVMMPIGSSDPERMVLARKSQNIRKIHPMMEEEKKRNASTKAEERKGASIPFW